MTGKFRLLLLAMAVTAGLVAVAPAAFADTEVSSVAYECENLGTETVRVEADGTVQIRNEIFTGVSVSDDARLDGFFRRTSNATLYPDGTAVFWGVQTQRSHTYDGSWTIRFTGSFDGVTFVGHSQGFGSRDFAGLSVRSTFSPLADLSGSPCHSVFGASTATGVISY